MTAPSMGKWNVPGQPIPSLKLPGSALPNGYQSQLAGCTVRIEDQLAEKQWSLVNTL